RPKARIEAFSGAYSDYGDSHYVSTYKDWSELAQAYEKAASAKALPTDKIKTLAQQLTAEAKTPRAKALLLSDWVRKNIRYVALWLGRDGVVPHAAESVLDNRYGDCKDHATLLLAMLKAVDIDGSTALINQGNRYQLPAVPVLSAFNHAIVYLPELDLYLDPTATVIAAGFLPVPELDKPVLLTKLGKLGHTPAVQRNDSDSQYTMALGSDGSAELKGDQHIAGALAELNRYILNNLPEAQKSKMVSNLLRTQNLTGDGQMLLNGKQDQPDQQSITITAHIDSLASLPGPVGMPTLTSLGGGIAANLQSFLSEASRSQPFACVPSKVREEVRFTLPKGVSINSLPKPLKLDDRYFAYQASYRQDGQAVLVQREMAVKPQSHLVCTAEDFTAMLPALKQMARDVSSQIIVAAE
ncbi:transglutaminase family protein, partial [Chitinimonas sp.]|uniref:transglutaminase-like domain-containing protein n=1 Tax=Chitinimonas sp. TaxID=1934313 RepID=UPI0035B4C02C